MSKFCGKCGAENIDQDSFYVKCGYTLNQKYEFNDNTFEENRKYESSSNTISENLSSGMISVIAKNLKMVFGAISMIICLLVLFLWKFDVKVTESTLTNLPISHEKMSLIDLASIQPGSVLGLVVLIFIIVAILSIINPVISTISSMILFFGGMFGAGVIGVVKDGIIDYTYKVANSGIDIMIQFLIPTLILIIICSIISCISDNICRKNPECKNKGSVLIFRR